MKWLILLECLVIWWNLNATSSYFQFLNAVPVAPEPKTKMSAFSIYVEMHFIVDVIVVGDAAAAYVLLKLYSLI